MKTALFLSELLSFRSLALGLFAARLAKYFLFGVSGFDMHWTGASTPGVWDHLGFIWGHCMIPYAGLVLVGYGIDRLVGPLFFRQEVAELRLILRG